MMQFYFLLPLPLHFFCFISHVLIRVTNCSFPDVSNTLIAVMYCVLLSVGVGLKYGHLGKLGIFEANTVIVWSNTVTFGEIFEASTVMF